MNAPADIATSGSRPILAKSAEKSERATPPPPAAIVISHTTAGTTPTAEVAAQAMLGGAPPFGGNPVPYADHPGNHDPQEYLTEGEGSVELW